MERRALLKLVALTALSQKLNALPSGAMGHMQPTVATPYTLQFFSEDESRLIDQLMEMILPADEHSAGAHLAKTNLFADLMIAAGDEAAKKRWRDCLLLIRKQAAASTLADALRTAAANEEDPKTGLDHFFVELKQMTVNGYYTSEIGIHQEMQYLGNAYLAAYPECSHAEHNDHISNSSSSTGVSG